MKNIRKEFQKILQDYPTSDFQSDEKNYENAIIKTDWILKHVPKKIYRFRACNKYTIPAFENDEIWGTIATKQNDIMEYFPYFDWNKIYEDIDFVLNNIENYVSVFKAITSDKPPLELEKLFDKVDIEKIKNNIPENISVDLLETSMKITRQKIVNQIKQNEFNYLNAATQQIFLTASRLFISCFSEENDSSYLWGNYADNNTGFCIEYDMSQYFLKCPEHCNNSKKCSKFHTQFQLAPVIYSSIKPDASSVLANVIIEDLFKKEGKLPKQYLYTDNNIANNLAFYKSDKWQEKEWRLIGWNHSNKYIQHDCILRNIKPSAVYLGTKIEEINEKKLIEICKQKNIPCFKAFQDFFSPEYKYSFLDVNYLSKNTLNNKEIT